MYKIYINDTALILAEELPGGTDAYQQLDAEDFDFRSFYRRVKGGSPGNYVLVLKDPKKSFRKMRKAFPLIKAAGGLVKNEENQYLFIFRKRKWDLPKGKLDPGERNKKAAVREVEEECGIKVTEAGERLCKTWHVYEEKGSVVFKRTAWYRMKARNQPLIPQLEEDITEARWIAPGDFHFVKRNTYPLVEDIISLVEM
jgi:8-oxo-dGTP pyrophosphatase MutT (NUDIX family)